MAAREKTLTKWERRNIIIEDVLWRRLKDQAKAEDRTVSALIRVVLKRYLDSHAP